MKDKILKFYNENKIFIIFFVIAFAIHIFLPLNWADDAVFLKKTADKDILTFLKGSARPFTDGLTYIFTRNQWLWRILNPCVLTTLIWAIDKNASGSSNKTYTKIISIFAIFPTMVLVDAGFVATTVNYLWPVTFGILNFIPYFNAFNGKITNKFFLVFLIPLLVYSTNMQQMCAVMLACFLVLNIFFAIKKKYKFYFLLQFIITFSGTISSLLLNFTGDNSRILRETNRYFPEFAHLNIFEKIELGFSSTFYCMTMEVRQAFVGFMIFSVFLAAVAFKIKKSTFTKALSLIPIIFSSLFGTYSFFSNFKLPVLEKLKGELNNFGLEKASYSFEIIPDILFIILAIILVYIICSLVNKKIDRIISVFLFILGLGSRMIMGFSPTVWASGYRTYCIMFITFIYIAIIILSNYKKEIKNENF